VAKKKVVAKPTKSEKAEAKAEKKDARSLDRIAEITNRKYGPGTLVTGREKVTDRPRLPTGIFAVDFATGGGFPVHGSTCLWGPDAGGKSNLSINAMAMTAKICWRCFHPLMACICSQSPILMRSALLDIEGTFSPEWAEAIGATPESYHRCLGEYGEQYANIADDVLRADDCGLVVVDSLAALVPSDEMESAAEDQFYALQTRLIGRMVRKLKQRMISERKRDHPCLVVFINQMRTKIGGMRYENPETMSGGWGMRHEFSLLLRCVRKALKDSEDGGTDSKYKDTRRKKNLAERFSFSIRKAKVMTLAGVGEYIRLIEDIPELEMHKGQVDDYGVLMKYAKDYGIVIKEGSKWKYFKHNSDKIDSIKRLWLKNVEQKLRTQRAIIDKAKAQVAIESGIDETDTPEEL
jgi:recombination protein RecA